MWANKIGITVFPRIFLFEPFLIEQSHFYCSLLFFFCFVSISGTLGVWTSICVTVHVINSGNYV